jgi:type IV secretory pathway VirB10-like protein
VTVRERQTSGLLRTKHKIALWTAGGLLACCGGGTVLGVLAGPPNEDPAPVVTTAPAAPAQVADLPATPTRDVAAEKAAAEREAEAERQREEAEAEAKRAAADERQRVEREQAAAREQAEREAEAAEQDAEQAEEPYFANCSAARAAGAAPLYRGEPGYRPALDRDKDGDACE